MAWASRLMFGSISEFLWSVMIVLCAHGIGRYRDGNRIRVLGCLMYVGYARGFSLGWKDWNAMCRCVVSTVWMWNCLSVDDGEP